LTVKLGSGQRACLNSVAESAIVWVPKETSTEGFEGVLDAIPKFVAYPSTLLYRKLKVFLQPARCRIFSGSWQPRAMTDSVEQGKLVEAVSFEDAL
jgi:hypothetical protein